MDWHEGQVFKEDPRQDRVIARGSVLRQGEQRWEVRLVDRDFAWLASFPHIDDETAIPIPWAVINKLELEEQQVAA